MKKYSTANNGKILGEFSFDEIQVLNGKGEISHVYLSEQGWIKISEFIQQDNSNEIPPPPPPVIEDASNPTGEYSKNTDLRTAEKIAEQSWKKWVFSIIIGLAVFLYLRTSREKQDVNIWTDFGLNIDQNCNIKAQLGRITSDSIAVYRLPVQVYDNNGVTMFAIAEFHCADNSRSIELIDANFYEKNGDHLTQSDERGAGNFWHYKKMQWALNPLKSKVCAEHQ